MHTAFVNGEFCRVEEARISIFDRGFLFGDAVYEVLPVYHGQPYFVDQHIARLTSNLEKIKIKIPDFDWLSLIHKLVIDNHGGNLQVYIQVSRGNQGMRKHDIPADIEPSIIAFTLHNSYPTLAEKEKGLSAQTLNDYRWQRCDIKSTSLLANVLLNNEAVSSGFQTSILVRDGVVTEGSTANIFIVTEDGEIKCPPLNHFCLPGITRQITIDLINQLHWKLHENEFTLKELFAAHEVWLTSTTKEIFPITRINDHLINNGIPGEYWRTINKLYQQLIS